MIIAIDGPAGVGKSTVAKEVAKKLHFLYFDTGAMYRCFAYHILQKKISIQNEEAITAALVDFDFQIHHNKERRYLVNGVDVTEFIRSPEITRVVSPISSYKEVRKKMVTIQHRTGENADVVFEGRDMGTVVFPHADLKIFLTASSEIKAERRYQEMMEKFPSQAAHLSKEEILKEMEERDALDASRPISPLKKAVDSFLIDTTNFTVSEVVCEILKLYKAKCTKKRVRVGYAIIIALMKGLFFLLYRFTVYGRKHFIPGPALIAANHVSYLDPIAVAIACPGEIHFLAKEGLFSVPVLGSLIRYLNSHPVSRGTHDAKIFREAEKILKQNNKILLFPEGGRSNAQKLSPFLPGVGFLAQRTHCPIIPVYLHGTYEMWGKDKKCPKFFGKIACIFGSPLYFYDLEDKDRKEAVEEILKRTQQAIEKLKLWYESGATGSPP